MPDPEESMPRDPKAPVIVTVSSSSGTGGSGQVMPTGTPIILHVMRPITIVAVRATRVYLQTLLGLLTAGGVAPDVIPYDTFLDLLTKGSLIAIAPAGISVIQNLIEFLTQLDQKNPTLTV